MKREPCSLGSRTVLSGIIAAAVASVFAEGCGGEVRSKARENDASVLGDGNPDDAPVRCSSDAGIASTTIFSNLDGSGGRSPLWLTTYSVDPTCCEPQLQGVFAFGADAGIGDGCAYLVEVPCGAGEVDAATGCPDWCNSVLGNAGGGQWQCGATYTLAFDAGSAPSVYCTSAGCGTGRPPRGFVPRPATGPSALGRELARMAQLEAASVVAFDALHDDLARLGAPPSLLRSVCAAGRDEVRHARRVGREAERRGVAVPLAVVAPVGARSIERLAIDNAEEGCVRETFGAALVAVQAERATDPRVRALMRGIAADELRHAALSWRIARWLEMRLDAAGCARVALARLTALAVLDGELTRAPPGDDALGLPDRAGQGRLLAALRATLEVGDLATAA